MLEEYRLAWMIYAGSTLVLLAAGWWFMRNWEWSWLRRAILIVVAAVLLLPARGGQAPDAPAMPVLPLFVYQTLFEDDGAAPEVTANLVFASAGALGLLGGWGLFSLLINRRRRKLREAEHDPYLNEP
ncbi:hypothetical protein Maes01_00626 [Microbulbifer aestuariivivens]|uniref:MFS transporter n=1 Tax=Microbulbifer aestuariivivens TaxID=1908308 RepID=A0ABP9WLJ3_9GAMM